MNGDDLTKEELLSRFLQVEDRIDELERENVKKDEKIDQLEQQLQERDIQIAPWLSHSL